MLLICSSTTHTTVNVTVILMKTAGSCPPNCIICGLGIYEIGPYSKGCLTIGHIERALAHGPKKTTGHEAIRAAEAEVWGFITILVSFVKPDIDGYFTQPPWDEVVSLGHFKGLFRSGQGLANFGARHGRRL